MSVAITPYDLAKLDYSVDGTVRWVKRFAQDDFNDVTPGIQLSGLADIWEIGQIALTRIRVFLKSTTSGAGHPWIVSVRMGRLAQYIKIGLFETSASKLDLNSFDCFVPLYDAIRELPGDTYLISIADNTDPPTAHTADDIQVTLEGFCVPRGPAPVTRYVTQPVSIERYRWPLERIR